MREVTVKIRFLFIALGLLRISMASAADLIVHLPGAAAVSRKSVKYQCDNNGPKIGVSADPFVVEYIEGGGNSLVIVPFSKNTLIFANVIAASGARYVAGPYTWWDAKGSVALTSDSLEGKTESTCKPIKTN